MTGVSHYINGDRKRKILSVAVEPKAGLVIAKKLAGQKPMPGPHKIQVSRFLGG